MVLKKENVVVDFDPPKAIIRECFAQSSVLNVIHGADTSRAASNHIFLDQKLAFGKHYSEICQNIIIMLKIPSVLRSLLLLSLLLQAACTTSLNDKQASIVPSPPLEIPVDTTFQSGNFESTQVPSQSDLNHYLSGSKKQLNEDEIFEKIFPATVLIFSQIIAGGSGVIVTPSGYVITNSHVIVTNSPLKRTIVTTNTGTKHLAKFIRRDKNKDLALLKIQRQGNETLPYIQFGNDKNLRYKDKVFALGYALSIYGCKCYSGSYHSIRDFTVDASYWLVGTRLRKRKGFICHRAATFPGMSGGPLVDSYGSLVGINSASTRKKKDYCKKANLEEKYLKGWSYAVPLSDVKVFLRASGIPELQELAK